jgi:hypothetical protein
MSDASASATVPAVLDIVSASATVYHVLSMLLCATMPWSDESSVLSALVSGALSSVGQRSCEPTVGIYALHVETYCTMYIWIYPGMD